MYLNHISSKITEYLVNVVPYKSSKAGNTFLTPLFERKHTIHRCLNGDFQFQCSNRPLLFDQKYK